MSASESTTYMSYADVRISIEQHPVRIAEVPTEHAISLPLPTMRLGLGAYCVFAGPAVRDPRQPLELVAPDRWWAIGAKSGRLLTYALTSCLPFASEPLIERVTVPSTQRSISAVREDLTVLGELVDRLAPVFFSSAGSTSATPDVDPSLVKDFHHSLEALVPPPAMGWYRALAPDLFSWLQERVR